MPANNLFQKKEIMNKTNDYLFVENFTVLRVE
jgi:hypothetical protein